jgi:hypothetical protein
MPLMVLRELLLPSVEDWSLNVESRDYLTAWISSIPVGKDFCQEGRNKKTMFRVVLVWRSSEQRFRSQCIPGEKDRLSLIMAFQ